ncbi:MAG TPA: prepilin-type N-terminal cleavage/methylation domain-containing protein [Tepidisphaeraceae bacterium]
MAIRHPGFPLRQLAPPSPPRARTAFTFVELLIVIGIIALLLGILLPVISRARASGYSVSCLSNLHQISTAFNLYANDNQGRFPDPVAAQQSWESLLFSYVPSRESFHCQADGGLFDKLRSSYDWRDTPNPLTTLAGKVNLEIHRPKAVVVFDALPDWHVKGQINAAMADGSVESMSYQDCLRDIDQPIRSP